MMSLDSSAVACALPAFCAFLVLAAAPGASVAPVAPDPRQDQAGSAQVLPPPGEIPAEADEEARRRWNAFYAAQTPEGGAQGPIRGFQLAFAMRLREAQQSNDGDATFTFLDEPGYIRCTMQGSGRTLLLGPDGPFLIDAKGASSLKGRDGKDDRRKLYEWVAIARNFLALSQPERVRLLGLRALDTSGFAWSKPELETLASSLDWLEVRSPDFQLYSSSDESPSRESVFRARLGLERASTAQGPDGAVVTNPGGKLVLAILHEEIAGVPRPSSLQVIHVRRHALVDGYRLPAELAVWRASEAPPPGTMTSAPYAELWLQAGGDLDPALTPEDFRASR